MKGDLFVGAVAVVLGVLYSAMSLRLPKAMIGKPWAPIYFPLALGVMMALLGALLCVNSLKTHKKKASGQEEGSGSEGKQAVDKDFPKLAIGTVVLCLLYAAAFNRFGFIVSTLLFLGGMLFLVNGRKAWLTNIAVSAAFTFGAWGLFEKLLMINLP